LLALAACFDFDEDRTVSFWIYEEIFARRQGCLDGSSAVVAKKFADANAKSDWPIEKRTLSASFFIGANAKSRPFVNFHRCKCKK
jgi:hypothetical protein